MMIAGGESSASAPIRIIEADLSLADHQQVVLAMVDACSRDAMAMANRLIQLLANRA
jgi:hypothetical protein